MDQDQPTGFHQTILGPLPQEWGVVRLGDLFSADDLLVQYGFAQGQHNQTGAGIPHLRPFNVTTAGRIDLSQIKYVAPPSDGSPYWVEPGDIIFNNTNSEELVGKTAFFPFSGKFVLSNHMTILRVLNENMLDAFWLSQELLYLWQHRFFQALCRRHVNQASVSLARLQGVAIPLPPLPEQRAIAGVLRTVQQAIAATEQVLAAARELKRSLLQHLFTYGPVAAGEAVKVPLHETEIGLVPGSWRIVRVGDIFEIKLGKMLSQASKKGVSPRPYLRNANVQWGHIDLRDIYEMDFTTREMALFRLRKDDLLVCEGGEIGRTAIWEDQFPECYYQKAIHRLRPKQPNALPRFFLYYMMLVFLIRRVPIVQGARSTIAHLPVEKLAIMPAVLPSLLEQREIIGLLAAVDRKIAAEQAHRAALQSLFESLLQNLMTGRARMSCT